MLPNNDNYEDELDEELEPDFFIEREPSLTYAMKLTEDSNKDNSFLGKVDEEDAIRQAILKMINTERYENEIYSWDYGIETQDLFGMPVPYVMSEIKRRIEDALLSDDRIESVDDFEVECVRKGIIHCNFTVTTAQGDEIEEDMEVEI